VSRSLIRALALSGLLVTWATASCKDHSREMKKDVPDGGCQQVSCVCDTDVVVLVPRYVRSAPMVLRGTARHSSGRAIESILIAARPAANDSFNFRTFNVTLERADLEHLPTASAVSDAPEAGNARTVSLPIVVHLGGGQACDLAERLRPSFAVDLEPEPEQEEGDASTD
jgi:hypothetical protein